MSRKQANVVHACLVAEETGRPLGVAGPSQIPSRARAARGELAVRYRTTLVIKNTKLASVPRRRATVSVLPAR